MTDKFRDLFGAMTPGSEPHVDEPTPYHPQGDPAHFHLVVDPDPPRRKAGRLLFLGACLMLLICVALALVVSALALRNSTQLSEQATARGIGNAARIDDLQAALKASADQLSINRLADADSLACDLRMTDAVDTSFRQYVSGIGDIVVALGQVTAERTADVASSIDRLDDLNTAARLASAQRAAYIAAGRPLPCPLA